MIKSESSSEAGMYVMLICLPLLLFAGLFMFQSCRKDSIDPASGTFVDQRDGNEYDWVKIGEQVWMTENLRSTEYLDGASIPEVADSLAWSNLSTGAYCWYKNDIGNKAASGALYNWYAVNTGKLCPSGWHTPSLNDWNTLANFLGGESVAGGKMKTTTGWASLNTEATNESGFSGLPCGHRYGNGSYFGRGADGFWWSSNSYSEGSAIGRVLSFNSSNLYGGNYDKQYGFSVRCVRD